MPNNNAQNVGKTGERYATHYLRTQGYKIVAQNYHARYGEIDIIACKNLPNNLPNKEARLIFIEVKTRKSNVCGEPEESISRTKSLRIYKTIMHYLIHEQTNKREQNDYMKWQVDVIAIKLNSFDELVDLRHYTNVTLF